MGICKCAGQYNGAHNHLFWSSSFSGKEKKSCVPYYAKFLGCSDNTKSNFRPRMYEGPDIQIQASYQDVITFTGFARRLGGDKRHTNKQKFQGQESGISDRISVL